MVHRNVDVDWPRMFWIGFGVVLASVVVFVAYSFIGTLVFGIFLYYATRPLYRRVYRRLRQRTAAALVSLFLLALPVITLLYYTIAIALQEFSRFAETVELGPYADAVEPYLNVSEAVQDPQSLIATSGAPEALFDTATQLLSYIGVIGTGLIHGFVMFALAFYLLRDGSELAQWAEGFLDHRGVLNRYFQETDRSFHKVFYGNILNAIVTGAIGALTFSIVDFVAPAGLPVPYPALTGLLAGAASLIPIIGMKIVYVPMTLYLGIQAAFDGTGWWFVGLFFGAAFIVVDTIPDLLVRPYVSSGKSLSVGPLSMGSQEKSPQPGIHTGTLMFAYILGPFLFGWYGIFLAPMIMVLVVHFVRFVFPELIAGGEIQSYAIDPTNLFGDETGSTTAGEESTESSDP
jgi:predicted PurR-regulated permease PerM